MQENTDDTQSAPEPPIPAVEVGDWVELRTPHVPMLDTLAQSVRQSMVGLVLYRARQLGDDIRTGNPLGILNAARDDDDYRDITVFDHGIVVEQISGFEIRQTANTGEQMYHIREETDGNGIPRNVCLHLFNPATGLMYLGAGRDTPAKPEYVDHHVAELRLRHKATDSWGTYYDCPLWELYEQRYGIEDPFAEEGGRD